MPTTPYDVYVFDFDGTLVDSAERKRQAFFEVFPASFSAAIDAVLARDPDGSRHHVIPEMIVAARHLGLAADELDAGELIEAYGHAVDDAVATAPAMPHVEAVLRNAGAATAYVASMTPDEDLKRYLTQRGWLKYLRDSFGYPHAKADVIARLLSRHHIPPDRLIMIGDGKSDREAAERNRCAFHSIANREAIMSIPGLEVSHHV